MYAITKECANIMTDHTYPIRAHIDGYFAHIMIDNKLLTDVYICKLTLGLNGSLCNNFKSLTS